MTLKQEWIIAVKRDKRQQIPDWNGLLSDIPGLSLKASPPGSFTVQVEATAEAISEAKARLSETCHIEPVISHGFNRHPAI